MLHPEVAPEYLILTKPVAEVRCPPAWTHPNLRGTQHNVVLKSSMPFWYGIQAVKFDDIVDMIDGTEYKAVNGRYGRENTVYA